LEIKCFDPFASKWGHPGPGCHDHSRWWPLKSVPSISLEKTQHQMIAWSIASGWNHIEIPIALSTNHSISMLCIQAFYRGLIGLILNADFPQFLWIVVDAIKIPTTWCLILVEQSRHYSEPGQGLQLLRRAQNLALSVKRIL
jgi:hypothetical protein